jgi:hypothetical protein
MSAKRITAFDRYVAQRMASPVFAAAHAKATAEIATATRAPKRRASRAKSA